MASFTSPIASFTSDAFSPDSLILCLDDLVSRAITVASGQGVLVRGSLLGKITIGGATSAAKGGGNTGNGTCVVDVTTPVLTGAIVGVYTVRCTVAGTNSATFVLTDPHSNVLATVSYAGAGGTASFANEIKFVVTDGATDFIVGDGFDITVAAGSGKYKLAASAAVDGSAVPDCILFDRADATSTDAASMGYFRGRFNQGALTFGTGTTATSAVIEGLRLKGIDLISIVSA